MYMAYTKKHGKPHYVLRTSCRVSDRMEFKNIFDIGPDPGVWIKYAGGNAFYFDETMEEAVNNALDEYDADELEDIFWPWVRQDVRRAVETFRHRGAESAEALTRQQKKHIATKIHTFDKRRVHFLKFGLMDQGRVEQMPPTLFRHLMDKSRDEIEQDFMRREFSLKARELKSYVYTIFDLQRFFQSFMAKKMPQAMDQEKVDAYLIEELCRLNKLYFDRTDRLDEYMLRYAIMFFDHTYANSTLLDDFANAFMNSRRAFRPPPPKSTVTRSKALEIFGLSKKELETMNRWALRKQYRRLAREHHPDAGGSDESFVQLNDAYQTLLEKIL